MSKGRHDAVGRTGLARNGADVRALTGVAGAEGETGRAVAQINNLRVTFQRGGKRIHALRGVSLEIAPGEVLGLVGESGSGKSMLGMSLLGLLPGRPTIDGSVTVGDTDMVAGSDKQHRTVRRLDLGAVFQDPMTSLNPTMRVGNQVIEAAGTADEAERLLSAVGIPDARRRMSSFPHEFSGGLRQRVMIAMAIAGNPSLIIADEPTTALDVTVQAQVLALLARLRQELGCSVLFVTHDLGVAAQIADRIAVLYAGRVVEIGPTKDVLEAPAHPYTTGLLRSRLSLTTDSSRPLLALPGEVLSPAVEPAGCSFYARCPVALEECASTHPELEDSAPGHARACIRSADLVRSELHLDVPDSPAGDLAPVAVRAEGPALLRVVDVTRSYKVKLGPRRSAQLQALRSVSLEVAHGESVAIVGESGSGKSTLLRVIAGLETHDGGTVELRGTERPQMVFQDAGASLTPWLTVGELIEERLRGRGVSRSQRQTLAAEALAGVGLPAEIMKARAGQLSGGQRQRVGLARATVIPPPILLCDEPTSALDVSLAASVLNLIAGLRARLDMSILFVTHDLAVARVVADRIAVMYLGRIVELGDADQVISAPVHPYTKSLLASVPGDGPPPVPLRGEPASPLNPPHGCAFHPRCPVAVDACGAASLNLELARTDDSEHRVACIRAGEST